jgi:hypothetical protein
MFTFSMYLIVNKKYPLVMAFLIGKEVFIMNHWHVTNSIYNMLMNL